MIKSRTTLLILAFCVFDLPAYADHPASFIKQEVLQSMVSDSSQVDIDSLDTDGNDPGSDLENPQYLRKKATRVVENSLKLFGRGFSGKESEQRLAVACVGKDLNCDVFQFVYFRAPGETYAIGERFSLKIESKKGSPQKTFQKVMKVYTKSYFAKKNHDLGCVGFIGLTVGGVIVGGIAASNPLIIGSMALIVLGIANTASGNEYSFFSAFDFVHPFKAAFRGSRQEALINQDDWNWGVTPVSIKERYFGDLVESISAGKLNRRMSAYLQGESNP